MHAVDDVSLTLPAGGITAIVGESGSGKSTLAKLLARLIRPTSGDARHRRAAVRAKVTGGPELRTARSAGAAGPVRLAEPDPRRALPPGQAAEAARHPGIARRSEGAGGSRRGDALDQAVADLLARVSLTPPDVFTDKYPHELSGGQRQRVAIARALAVAPSVLLADEPVSMLDVSIRLGVLNLLADLRERDGLAIVYVTHDIASARYLADTIAVMYAGRIVETGPAATVTDQPAHPYTQLLLSAAPDPDRAQSPSLRGRGAPPNLVTPPPGCRFHPRCPHAMAVCAETCPPMSDVSNGQSSACWLHADGLSAATEALAVSVQRSPHSHPHPDNAAEPGEEA